MIVRNKTYTNRYAIRHVQYTGMCIVDLISHRGTFQDYEFLIPYNIYMWVLCIMVAHGTIPIWRFTYTTELFNAVSLIWHCRLEITRRHQTCMWMKFCLFRLSVLEFLVKAVLSLWSQNRCIFLLWDYFTKVVSGNK